MPREVVLTPHLGFVNDPVFARFGPGVVANLLAWLERIHARPAYRRALEVGGPYAYA